jgi:hypothetical protein
MRTIGPSMTLAALRLRQPVAFTTNLAGQGPVARVDYRTTAGGTEELSLP